ncbi:MAG: insulinase family protein [Deltaproteobacteria bacterium]|nr:insulinase family protein [Deltaproteobacteria bacterium]
MRQSQKEIERLKKQYQAELLQIRDDPSDFASLSFIKKLYDKHPYATPQLGTLDGLKNIKREHVVSFYKGHLIPHNAVVAVVGDFETSKMHGLLEKFFAGWAGNSHVVIPSNSEESRKNESETTLSKSSNSIFPSLKESKIYVIHKPGLSQSQIRIGTLAIPRTHPDYFQYLVSNHLFGGAFGALLNQKIRDDLGLTYSIYSQLKPGMMTGHWAIQTFTRNDQLSKTVQEIFSLLSKFQDLASEEDLKQAKAHLSGSFLLSQETVESMASTLLLYRSLGLPSEELKNWRSKVESINLKQVTHIAQNYWTGKNVVILVLTDEKTKIEKWPIEASVSELSFEEVPL